MGDSTHWSGCINCQRCRRQSWSMDSYSAARSAFEAYAGIDAPGLPENPLSALQVRLARWQVRNFGIVEDLQLAAGVGEEVGELIESWTGPDSDGTGGEELDAAADIAIYAMNLCTNLRLDFGSIVPVRATWVATEAPIVAGKILHAALKHKQGIRGFADKDFYRETMAGRIGAMKGVCELVCRTFGQVFEDVLHGVAETVMKREWRTKKENINE